MNKKLLNSYSPIPTTLPGFEHQSLPETVSYLNTILVFPYLKFDQLTYYKPKWYKEIMTITFNDNFSTHYIVLGFELVIKEELSLGTIQHEKYKWFTQGELLKSDEVYSYVKDYFNIKKGIKND